MSRNLRALGLALVAALALGAIGAQGASAVVEHSFRSDASNEETVATVQNEGNHVFKLGTNGPAATCTSATLSGTYYGNTLDVVTIHPKYTSCTVFGGAATINTNGCNFIFDSDTTTGGHFSGEHAAVSLECEAGHDISVAAGGCTITVQASHSSVPVNQSLHGVQYSALSNSHGGSSKHSLTANATIGQIHYTTIGAACAFFGKAAGTYTDGIYEGKASATGYEATDNSPGSTTTLGTTWNHGPQVNITISTPT